MMANSIEQFRVEPTVFGAVYRYRTMVLVIALMTAAVAVTYTSVVPEVYRANASITVPEQRSVEDKGSNQYLDSQVLLLQSQDVAQRAVRIANAALGSNRLAVRDFSGDDKLLKITTPERVAAGTYGASTITVSFTWPDAKIAQLGANAVLQAFDEARSAAIRAQGNATLAAITKAMVDAQSQAQRSDLLNQRTQALVNQQIDLVHHPTIARATEPHAPINYNLTKAAAVGLLIGTVLGAALAFARARSHSGFDSPLDAAAVYGVPLIGKIPPSKRKNCCLMGLLGLASCVSVHSRIARADPRRGQDVHVAGFHFR